jgi:hypothetical protein
MKTGKLFLMVLIVLLGMVVAAPAITLHSPWQAGPNEANLYQDHGAWGSPADNHSFQYTTPWENLLADRYSIHHFALNLGEPRPWGMHHWARWIPERHDRSHDHGLHWLTREKSRHWEWHRTFSEAPDFGRFEATRERHTFPTIPNHSSAFRHHHWDNDVSFDLDEFNLLYIGQYLIAFEPGGNLHNFWSLLEGNFLMIQVYRLDDASPVPLPGTLPLVGGGLLGLVTLRYYRRRFTSSG